MQRLESPRYSVILMLFVIGLILVMVTIAYGHSNDVPYAEWMGSLMRPNRVGSCCGPGDQYYAKEYTTSYRKGIAFVAVVDENGVDVIVDVPNEVVIWDRPNPTGRGVVFMIGPDNHVICFVPGTGT